MKPAKKQALPARDAPADEVSPPATRAVYAPPPVQLGVVVAREGDRWRVRVGREERLLSRDASVDEALVDEAMATGARVVVDLDEGPAVVGVLLTRRALTVTPDGDVEASVRRFKVSARDEAVLQTPGAFVRAKGDEVELFGARVLTRAREVARILARMIKLN